jgi:quercetin dioxygenase-like cupin family protein
MQEDLKSRALAIEDLIEYQEGSVVSREIVRKETGTVTIFAFDKGEGLSEHSAPFDAMVQIVDGTALITIGGEENTVKKGQMIIMPANIPHALHAVEKYKMVLTMIRSEN